MAMARLSRLLTSGLLGAVLIAGTATTPATATGRTTEANRAAGWLAGQLVDGALPGFAGPDWGLTIDAVFALSATQVSPTALDAASAAVAAHVRSYNSFDDFGVPGVRIAGATAKLLVGALAAGKDPTAFGGFNLRQETLDLVAESGRVSDKGTNSDDSNTFGQALAVLGLARTGGAPKPVVDFLLRQQCVGGGFRLTPEQDVCDPDSTAMAVQALLVADQRDAAERGAAWLLTIQRADGSFGGSGPTEAPNSNSTGLAAQALAATGHTAEAERAAGFLATHQLATGPHAGAVAYNDDAFTDAVANGIPDFGLDQWRRATAQATLGLAMVAFGSLPGTPPPTEPTTPTSPSPTSSPAPPETTTSQPPAAQGSTAPALAATGVPVGGLLLAAGLLIGCGVAVRYTGRRWRRSP